MRKQRALFETAKPGSRSAMDRARVLAPILALLVGGYLTTPSFAQGWTPTVATSPGGSFNPPPESSNGATVDIDPRYFPSPHDTAPPARNHPVPQGQWSPIVTGALPETGEPPRPVQRAPLRKVPGATVAPIQSLSPIRPTVQAQAATGSKAGTAAAEAPARVDATEAALGRKGALDALPPNASAAQQYCFNTADSAADARFAWQAKKIKDMEAELEKRAQQLEAKTAEYKTWLERRDEFARKAHEKLVGFYSGMRPDAAAGQLAELDEEMAAAVVIKLQTKVASQIMGEMDPERAAKIATIISGAAKVPPNRRRPAEAPANAAPAAGASTPEGPRS